MKKIGIVTWHSIPNHGGMLQMYGLYKTFQALQTEPLFVLYKKVSNESSLPHKMSFLDKVVRYSHLDSWRSKINYRTDNGFNKEKREQMLSFQSDVFNTASDFSDCDAACVGSDEVFSVVSGFTPEFFGENIEAPVFSYAGSCGQTDLQLVEELGLTQRMKQDFLSFKALSVRDENSAKLVHQLTEKIAPIHIDPVLLYGYKDIVDHVPHKSKKEIILYSYDESMNTGKVIHTIKRIARHKKDKVLSAGFHHYWCDESQNFMPFDLIKEFCAAEGVITDTFHGAVISVITHSQFAVMVRSEFNSHKIIGLLKLLHLEDRLADNLTDLEKILDMPIDYQQVEERLEYLRGQSMEYLRKCIAEV